MTLQVLIATMHQMDHSLLEKMKICANIITPLKIKNCLLVFNMFRNWHVLNKCFLRNDSMQRL